MQALRAASGARATCESDADRRVAQGQRSPRRLHLQGHGPERAGVLGPLLSTDQMGVMETEPQHCVALTPHKGHGVTDEEVSTKLFNLGLVSAPD